MVNSSVTWGDGLADLAADRARERFEEARRTSIRWTPSAELIAEAEYLDFERCALEQAAQDGTITEDYAAIVGAGIRDELRLVLAELDRRATLADRGISWRHAPGRITADFAQAVKARFDGATLAEFLAGRFVGTRLRHAGSGFRGWCPLRPDHHSASLSISASGLWFCHSCATGGDVFSFLQAIGVGWAEAVKIAAAHVGMAQHREPARKVDSVRVRLPDPIRPHGVLLPQPTRGA